MLTKFQDEQASKNLDLALKVLTESAATKMYNVRFADFANWLVET